MGKFASAAFYLFICLAFVSTLVILLSKQAKYYTLGAICAFISIGGLYLLLKSPVMFIFEIVFFVTGLGALLIYLGNNTQDEDKTLLNLNFKTLLAPAALGVFALLVTPFLTNQVYLSKIPILNDIDFLNIFIDTFDLNILLISLIAIAALAGFYTIAFWRKK